jgi:PBSX family phage terminase large subunit
MTTQVSQRTLEYIAREALLAAKRQIDAEKALQRFEMRGLAVQSDPSREILLWGTARTGKSFAWLLKLHTLATKYPKFRGLIVRKTRASLSESALQTFETQVLGTEHPLVKNGPSRRFREVYKYSNGAEIVVDGMDKKTKILSAEFDFIFVQEANECTIDDIEYLRTRLSNDGVPLANGEYFHQLAMDSNPDHPKHWLKQRFESGITKALQSTFKDNPRLYNVKQGDWTPFGKDYVFNTLGGLTGIRRDRFFLGLWVAAEGVIYDGFREEIHVTSIDALFADGNIPHYWPKIRVIDFGYKNPFVCHWYAINPNNHDMILYREIYVTGRLVEDVACEIKHLSGEYDNSTVLRWCQAHGITQRNERERIIETICDHDAEDRATLEKYGIPNIAAFKGVSLGIQAVQTRLQLNPDNTARIYFIRDALTEVDQTLAERKLPTQMLDEIAGYVWKQDKQGKPIKEEPTKIDDHGMDTLRYAVCYVDEVGVELQTTDVAVYEYENDSYGISPF